MQLELEPDTNFDVVCNIGTAIIITKREFGAVATFVKDLEHTQLHEARILTLQKTP